MIVPGGRRSCLLLALGLVAGVAALPIVARYRTPFTRCEVRRVRAGMTRDEVIQVLRCTPGDYSSGRGTFDFDAFEVSPRTVVALNWVDDEFWFTDECGVCVQYGRDGLVLGKIEGRPVPE